MIPLGERLLKVVIAENVERYRLEQALSKRELADQDDYFLLFRVVISITNVAKAIISDMASNTVTLTPFVKSLAVILAFQCVEIRDNEAVSRSAIIFYLITHNYFSIAFCSLLVS